MKNITNNSRFKENPLKTKENTKENISCYFSTPSKGLTIRKLEKIPKDLKKASNSILDFARETICGNTSRRNLEFTRGTVSKLIQLNQSKTKYDHIKSPTSHYSNRTNLVLNNKERLDFNFHNGEKFLNDAKICGIEKLANISLKRSSPYKYACIKNSFRRARSPDQIKHLNNHNYLNTETIPSDNRDQQEFHRTINGFLNSSKNLHTKFSFLGEYDNNHLYSRTHNEANRRYHSPSMNYQDSKHEETKYNCNNHNSREEKFDLKSSKSSFDQNMQEKLGNALEITLAEFDHIIQNFSLQQKLQFFLDSADDKDVTLRLGSLISIYVILKNHYVKQEQKEQILSKIICLLRNHKIKDELFLIACVEICYLFSHSKILIENINLIQFFMSDFDFPRLQKAAFYCLMNMGYEGIKSLVELATQKNGDYQHFILNNMLQTPHFQKILIVRALLNDLHSNDPFKRHSSLMALSKMYDLLNDKEILDSLHSFIEDTKIEKILLVRTIRNAGPLGEEILIDELKTNSDITIRLAIASVFSYRTPKYPNYLSIKLDPNDNDYFQINSPGSFCKYIGEIDYNLDEENTLGADYSNYLEVNSRDLLSALQRMITIDYDHSNIQIVHRGSPYLLDLLNTKSINCYKRSYIIQKYSEFFELQFNQPYNKFPADIDDNGKFIISDEIIKSLGACLRDQSSALRETAACSLGKIGLPESLNAVENLINSCKDFENDVKAKAIWALGRIAPGCDDSAIDPVIESLKSNFWKVKSACLYTLSRFGPRCAKKATSSLLKLLKESPINKQNVSETLIKLGYDGENNLLRIINSEDDSNYKLKSAIIRAFALSDLSSPNIDFIIESLFKAAKSNSFLIKQNAVFSIKFLSQRANENINYLKKKNLIPFFYELLRNREYSIQMVISI